MVHEDSIVSSPWDFAWNFFFQILTVNRTEDIMKHDPPPYHNWVSRTPLSKLGKLANISSAVVYLLSDASSYMTGAAILIGGSYCAI